MAKKKSGSDPRKVWYQITLDRQMLGRVRTAMELMARFQCGQFQDLLETLRDSNGDCIETELAREITKHLDRELKPAMGLNPNASWGVGHNDEIDSYWDLYTAARYQLAWDRAIEEGMIKPGEPRKWPEMMQVIYDEPTTFSGHFVKVSKMEGGLDGSN
jgi:hypothetical protein